LLSKHYKMKTPLALLLLAATMMTLFVTSCTKEDVLDQESTCRAPSFTINGVGNGGFYLSQSSTGGYGFYEIQYGTNGFSLGSGTIATVAAGHTVNGLANGTYDVYLRGNCGGSDWSEWFGPVSTLITDGVSGSCQNPDDLGSHFSTQYERTLAWYSVSGSSYFEVELGSTGFSVGDGTLVQVNGQSYRTEPLSPGIYDFYVRTNCGGNEWSGRSGPASFVIN
jgi:hypothetical protein